MHVTRALETHRLLLDLTEALELTGFASFCDSFHPGSGFEARVALIAERLDPELGETVDLLLLRRAVEPGFLPGRVAEIAGRLDEIFVRDADGRLALDGLTLRHTMGLWLFLQPEHRRNAVYFGDDTIGLAARLRPRPQSACLDFCTGPGTQALLAGRAARMAVGVEVNPVAAAIANLNVAANGVSNTEIVLSDLAEFRTDQRFDFISANPPLLPVPSEIDYPFIGDGGEDGLRVTERILARAGELLAPEGVAEVIGLGLGIEGAPAFLDKLAAVGAEAGLFLTVHLLRRTEFAVGSGLFNGLILSSAGTDPAVQARHHLALEGFVDANAIDSAFTFAVHARRAEGRPGIRVLNLTETGFGGLWSV